jgi:hypothetical protein
MLDSLEVSSFDSPSSQNVVFVFLSCTMCYIGIQLRTFFCCLASIVVEFLVAMIFCGMLFLFSCVSISSVINFILFGLTPKVLKTFHATTTL